MVDFIEFENALQKDSISLKEDIEKDSARFREILLLYKGELLGEVEDWVIPIRNRYDRLYVKGISFYIGYLKNNQMNNEIISICEKAIDIKPYEETIHIAFIEALIELKQNSYALIHYEFFTKRLFNDINVVPSKELKTIYKKIKLQKKQESFKNIDLNKMDNEMVKGFNFGGVIYCDIDYFKFIYNYKRRNKDRPLDKDRGTGIGIITIYSRGIEELTEKEIMDGIDQLGYTLFKTLRRGDVVSKWNDNQMIMMLYGLRKEHIQTVVDRINDSFEVEKTNYKLSLNIKLNIL